MQENQQQKRRSRPMEKAMDLTLWQSAKTDPQGGTAPRSPFLPVGSPPKFIRNFGLNFSGFFTNLLAIPQRV